MALLLFAAIVPSVAHADRVKRNELIRVISPVAHGTVPAHPFVNVIVALNDAADAKTFHARIGGADITGRFKPVLRNGTSMLQAEVEPRLIHTGRRANNRLRLAVRSVKQSGKGPRFLHDVDRLRFRAVEAPNQPPVVDLPSLELFAPNIPFTFKPTASDPDLDVLDYQWNFGDGSGDTTLAPTHVFTAESTLIAQLTVSDRQASVVDHEKLLPCPDPDDGRTRGILRIDTSQRLEFGVLPVGGSASRVLTVKNTDDTATSQLRVHFDLEGVGYTVTPPDLDLAAGASADVTATFAPTAPGHQSAEIVALASASNSCVAHMMAHGFAGVAPPGTGPTLAADPVFYADSPPTVPGTGTFAIFPSGARAYVDNTVHLCQLPDNGPGTADVCLTDRDCINGGTCPQTSTCVRGDRAGQPCSVIADCPNGFCPSQTDFDPLEMCGDGQGNLYLMSDEGTFTDITNDETELSASLLRISFDANGTRTGAQIVSRVTTQTAQLACDHLPASSGGRVYEAEFHNVSGGANCFRDGREALTALRKSSGASSILVPRLDAVEGLDICTDDIDESGDLQVSLDGSTTFATLSIAGLYRILPSALFITPDATDYFGVHPDGAVIVVRSADNGPTGTISVYKIFPNQALHGAVRLNDLTPCATLNVPNNGGSTVIDYPFAVGRAASGGDEGVILVSFVTTGGTVRNPIFASNLRVQGTAAFFSPAGSSSCTLPANPPTYINLDLLDLLTF